ncbi:MAG TPA: isoprenylcysteine carboxylmethyltransferase family protein [Verrucomicrobiae bacterium]|jgi:protein-S-isoprenylcysteine O-methyltransferase Ste14|nr:isoprenylcysteine carboxylmethyltransferase family protein [Verrucomicrobiae bacterium]
MPTTGEIIITCWCIFVVVWWVAAYRTKRTAEKQSVASMMAHRIPLGIGWWMMLIPKWPEPLNRHILPRTASLQISGAVICIVGLLFTLWARRTLAGNWSSDVTFKQDHELIRTGPYRFARHPIYTGLLVMWVGTVIYVAELRGVISLLLVTIGFWIKLHQEERLLLRHFPDSYPTYKREVKALVPFVV